MRREHPEFFRLLAHVATDPKTPPDLLRRMRARRQGFQGLLRQLIVEGQAAGEVAPDDPDQLVAAVFALVQGLTADLELGTRALPRPRDRALPTRPRTRPRGSASRWSPRCEAPPTLALG